MKQPRIDAFVARKNKTQELKSSLENMPVIEKPITPSKTPSAPQPVPPPVPRPVRGTVPLIPKTKRLIRQRQPFDIYEDQYQRLKKIADTEREYVNGRGMSQMVREALDNYLKEHSPKE